MPKEEQDGLAFSPSSPAAQASPAKPSKARAPSAALKAAMADLKSTGVGAEAVRLAAQHGSFDVSGAATWRAGQAAPFSFLTDAFEAIAAESKRLSIAAILTGTFRTLLARAEADLLPAVYLCTNRVAPAHEALELGLGDATLVKALAQATGRKEASVRAEYGACGDLGSVAAAARGMQKTMFPPPPLTIRGVFAAFRDIAAAEGQGSQDRKKALIAKLLVAARGNEAGYVMRALQGRLRIGLAEQTVLVALAHAVALRGEAKEVGGGAAEGGRGEGSMEDGLRLGRGEEEEDGSREDRVELEQVEEDGSREGRVEEEQVEEDGSREDRVEEEQVEEDRAQGNQAASVARIESKNAFTALQQARQITDLAASLEAASREVKRAYSQCPSYDVLVPALLARPLAELRDHVRFVPGVPVRPMLAKPATGVREVLDRFAGSEFSCEYKYDGERAQVHVLDGRVKIYSRNSEDSTGRFPDVAALFPRSLAPGVQSVVLDAEAVAFDRATGRPLPFQILSTRGRKDVQVEAIKVAVCVYCFDCLFCDGETLVDRPLRERREILKRVLVPAPGELEFASEASSSDVEELGKFLDEAVAAGTEGLIVKTLDGPYQPSKRASFWLKLKKDYLQGLGDTFDVVPIGAWMGKGKRTGVFGSYLLAIYDADAEEYQTICKIGTGFSEELLKHLAESLRTNVIDQPRRYYNYGETLVPDVWFAPHSVWEVKAADLSVSPVHRAALGQVERNKGLSIRFPRLVRVRDDKKPEDSTSPAQVADMYRRQALAPVSNGGEDEDY